MYVFSRFLDTATQVPVPSLGKVLNLNYSYQNSHTNLFIEIVFYEQQYMEQNGTSFAEEPTLDAVEIGSSFSPLTFHRGGPRTVVQNG